MTRRLARLALASVLVGGCGLPHHLKSGVNGYSTDLVMGAQTKPEPPPPPAPVASLTPGFPSFIAPPPPPPPSGAAEAGPPTAPTTTRPTSVTCAQASLYDVPKPVPADVGKAPKAGVYPYRQDGAYRFGGGPDQRLPVQVDHLVTNVVLRDDGTYGYDVAVTQLGAKTTTSYGVLKPSGRPDVDGIYITNVVVERADGGKDAFTPLGAQGAGYGLRILPLPAATALSWDSVATDPIRGSSMVLHGVVKEPARVDACGTVIEGWSANVTIESRGFGKVNPITIAATYIIAPQLGGLIIGDDVTTDDPQPDQQVHQKSASLINSLVPVRPAPR
jgi:hypothetical protein